MSPTAVPNHHIHWQTLERLLETPAAGGTSMPGFDDEFRDIVDYIIKITYRIWEQKNVGLCLEHYSEVCPVHTLGSLGQTVDEVVQNTVKTLAAFPDRTLIGENVVWSRDGEHGYYTSHRITSAMTNSGWSEFGPPTGRTAKVTTIADCICVGNRIVYEWLMRDNSYLVRQLGLDELDIASRLGAKPVTREFRSWWDQEFARVRAAGPPYPAESVDQSNPDVRHAHRWLDSLFNQRLFGDAWQLYWPNARVEWPGGRHCVGPRAVAGTLVQWLAQVPDGRVTCDHIAAARFDERSTDVAIRWTLAGHFDSRSQPLQALRGLPALLLGSSHLRIVDGRIAEEWTVFDEIAFFANLFRSRTEREDG
jgi:hypothetical protein